MINKNELLKSLQADFKAAEIAQKEWVAKRDEWIAETYGKKYGNEVKGESQIVSKDIKRQLEWIIPGMADPFLSTPDVIKCNPITFEDVDSARQNELLLNTQFTRTFDRYNFISRALRVLVTEGTLVVQTGWEYEDEKVIKQVQDVVTDPFTGVEQIVTREVEEVKVNTNKPTAKVCRGEDVYIDPTAMGDLDKAQFVVYRYETDLSTLRKDGRYKNLKKVAQSAMATDYDYRPEDLTYFKFSDVARKKIMVHEYWGNYDMTGDGIATPIVCVWTEGNIVIRLEDNPYPDKKAPFLVVPFTPIPFQLQGEALAENIGDRQKVKTAITRGLINNMAKSNNGQVGIRKGALSVADKKKFLSGKNFEFNGSQNDFWQGSYNQIPSSAFNMMALMDNDIESQTGQKSFSGGINSGSMGNMLDINTDIPMIDGTFKRLADIEDGDKLIGSDGHATTVTKAHTIKLPKIAYDMKFDNGSIIKSGGEHLWTIKVNWRGGWKTVDANTVYKHIQKGHHVTVPRIKELHTGKPTGNSISPYVLGFWLGDGMSHSARITTEDIEILQFFKEEGYTCVEVKDSSKTGKAKMYDVYKDGCLPTRNSVTGHFESTGSLHSELRALGLHARYGGVKHIPEEYFTATYEEKMELIRGLMDSDGYAHNGAFVRFCQSEGQLKDDMLRLLKTLGLKVSVITRDKDVRNNAKLARTTITGGKMIWQRKDSYEIGFTPWSNPFKLTRKANKWRLPSKETTVLKSMSIVDKVHMRCLTVDSIDKLFAVTNKYTLTHNTATGARAAMDATGMRKLNLVRNVAENLMKPLMRKWMAYNSKFLSEEEVVRTTNSEFVPIRRDDLSGKIDIDITISTAEDNSAKAQQLSFLMQTIGNTIPGPLTQIILAEITRLQKMPGITKQIEDYKPEKDPAEEQAKQLEMKKSELENERLKAQVADLYARAGENKVDERLKNAKAAVEEIKASKLASDKDMVDLQFLKDNEGIDHQQKMELEELKARMNLLSMQMQAKNGDSEIGVYNG